MSRLTPFAILVVNGLAFAQPATNNAPPPPQPSDLAAWEILKTGIQDGDPEHRKQAIDAVGTMGAVREAVQLVEQALQDKSTLVRQKAAATLGEMGSPDAIPALNAALDDSPEVSFTAAKSLWTLGDVSTREILWQVLKGERKDTPSFVEGVLRRAKHKLRPTELALMGAKEAAGVFGPGALAITAAQEVVKESKKSSGALGRVVVAEILAKDSDPYNRILLEWALGDDSSHVRAAVAEALGECGNQDTVLKLAPLLSDDRHAVQYMAAASIIKLHLKFAGTN